VSCEIFSLGGGCGVLGSDFIVAEDEIGKDLSELSGDIWRDEGIHWCALCQRSKGCTVQETTGNRLAGRGERFRLPVADSLKLVPDGKHLLLLPPMHPFGYCVPV
jgi:hypothetical protein